MQQKKTSECNEKLKMMYKEQVFYPLTPLHRSIPQMKIWAYLRDEILIFLAWKHENETPAQKHVLFCTLAVANTRFFETFGWKNNNVANLGSLLVSDIYAHLSQVKSEEQYIAALRKILPGADASNFHVYCICTACRQMYSTDNHIKVKVVRPSADKSEIQ